MPTINVSSTVKSALTAHKTVTPERDSYNEVISWLLKTEYEHRSCDDVPVPPPTPTPEPPPTPVQAKYAAHFGLVIPSDLTPLGWSDGTCTTWEPIIEAWRNIHPRAFKKMADFNSGKSWRIQEHVEFTHFTVAELAMADDRDLRSPEGEGLNPNTIQETVARDMGMWNEEPTLTNGQRKGMFNFMCLRSGGWASGVRYWPMPPDWPELNVGQSLIGDWHLYFAATGRPMPTCLIASVRVGMGTGLCSGIPNRSPLHEALHACGVNIHEPDLPTVMTAGTWELTLSQKNALIAHNADFYVNV